MALHTWVHFFVFLVVLLFGRTAIAAIRLPFLTTYDCVEQSQLDTGTWVTCDGQSKYLDSGTSNGSFEQITSVANFVGGSGGRGQRHWIGNGTNVASGEIAYDFTNGTPTVFTRWYVRFQKGLQLGVSGSPHKVQYFVGGRCAGDSFGCYFAINDSTIRMTNAGNNFDNGGSWGWADMMGGASSDGVWHCFESEVSLNTAGQSNGIARFWVDGVLRLDRTDVPYNLSSPGNYTGFILPSNGAFVTTGVDMYEDIDDVAVQTTGPIGCSFGSPPQAPTNLKVN